MINSKSFQLNLYRTDNLMSLPNKVPRVPRVPECYSALFPKFPPSAQVLECSRVLSTGGSKCPLNARVPQVPKSPLSFLPVAKCTSNALGVFLKVPTSQRIECSSSKNVWNIIRNGLVFKNVLEYILLHNTYCFLLP